MRSMFITLLALVVLIAASVSTDAAARQPGLNKRIALSFDDVPRARGAYFSDDERTERLIAALRSASVEQAAFFVNPGNISEGQSAAAERRIAAYVDAGHVIANHTATHPRLQGVRTERFLADLDAAEAWLQKREGYRPWFRFPYLDEGGPDLAKRDAARAGLRDRALINANVTVNASDWWFEQAAIDAREAGELLDLTKLRDLYVDAHVSAADFYDRLARRVTGRSIAHVMLLHETDLAALFVDDLVSALRQDGWEIVPVDEAYADPVYSEKPATPFAQGTLLEQMAWERDLPEPRWFDGNNLDLLAERFNRAMQSSPVKNPHPSANAEDPFIWLEDARSPRALAWVAEENQKTETRLQEGALYHELKAEALQVLGNDDRIPRVALHPGGVYNFWQDQVHPRGILRRSPRDAFVFGEPDWTTVLDIDALAEREGRNWVYRGLNCLAPELRRCLVSLSDGGEDAASMREFDMVERRFVDGGFALDPGMNFVAWIDENTLAVARDWGADSVSESGFPLVTKVWRRGAPLSEARELYRGAETDNLAWAYPLRDAAGRMRAMIAQRQTSFHERQYALLVEDRWVKLDWPPRAAPYGVWVSDNHLILALHQPWQRGDSAFPSDALLAYKLESFLDDPIDAKPQLIWQPGERQTRNWVSATTDALYVLTLDNVRSRALRLDYVDGRWESRTIDLPDNATVHFHSVSSADDYVLFDIEGFLSPPSLVSFSGQTGSVQTIRRSLPVFDATGMTVEQHQAVSSDGTYIPYFLVTGKGESKVARPLLMTGYGGFQGSQLPTYLGVEGRLWLERGGAIVLANLRGGGEFGPAWHQAAIRQNKQRTWDDFIAVAENLISRGVTTPELLAISGGSQGGLLVGAALTQRPDLFNAAVIRMPLFDMLRYHEIGQGASWVAEYGDPRIPEERAWLAAYSPYHRLDVTGDLPPPLIIASTADDRSHPAHARKAAARLYSLGRDYYYYETDDGGHSAGVDQDQQAGFDALEFTYLIERLMLSNER